MGSLVEENVEYMSKILEVNVSGMARINNLFFPLVERAKGRFINFLSEYGKFCALPFTATIRQASTPSKGITTLCVGK